MKRCPVFAIVPILLAAGVLHAAIEKDGPREVSLEGDRITIDDALFHGCYHNAFEGEPQIQADGTYKTGPQTIRRTKGVLFGADTVHAAMQLNFSLARAPKSDVTFTLNGLDDRFEEHNDLAVSLNGETVAESLSLDNNQPIGTSTRYYLGWKDYKIHIPRKLLRKGKNLLEIRNTTSALSRSRFSFSMVDFAVLDFKEPTEVTVSAPPHPIYTYGLSHGIEVNVWPTVNLGEICLVTDGDIEYNFFYTFPPPTEGAAAGVPTRTLHIVTSAPIEISGLDGLPLASKREGRDTHFEVSVESGGVRNATPHPGQGFRVMMRALKAFNDGSLTAWVATEGVDSLQREYRLNGVTLPVVDTEGLDFQMSIWGGGVPQEPERMKRYVQMVRRVGFNHMFTGETAELNRMLKEEGFSVYPRFGWFGGKYVVTDENAALASVGSDGTPSTRDFCPLAILENVEDPKVGRYYAQARKIAALPDIDGLCIDFEVGAVWCWCDRCVELFKKQTSLSAVRADLGPGGRFEHEYKDFGRGINGRLLGQARDVIKEVNPDLRYLALASACDMPAYWWDGRIRGRHALRELTKFADEIAVSAYFYGLPGGLKSVRPLLAVTRQFAVDSGRDVGVGLISPIATTVSETPRYRGAFMLPSQVRLEILLIAAGSGRGLALFRGDCFDGRYYQSVARAMQECMDLKPYIQSRLDRSFDLEIAPVGDVVRAIDLTVSQNLMSRMAWRPDSSYLHDAIMLNRNVLARDRVCLFFNYAEVPMTYSVKVRGLFDDVFTVSDFASGKEIARYARFDLEAGKARVTVPARDCVIWRVTSEE